jgi:hypothetical protein
MSKCDHNKLKKYCSECGGSCLCIHNLRKYRCKECNGSELCQHNKSKYRCKECGGSDICKHNKLKKYCDECDGTGLCIHKIRRSRCNECGGCDLCQHRKQKHLCKECDGSQICFHKKRKTRCKECDGKELCKSSWCETQCNQKYDGYCLYCYMNLFPDKPIARNYKTKEYAVVEHVKSAFPQVDWIADKKVYDGCSKRRPDLFLDLGDHIVIVEVDENQHLDYDCSCENKRLMELSQDVSHRPIVFIRFNPDEYTQQDVTITSCWGINGNGVCVVKKSKQKEWTSRLNALVDQVKYWIHHSTDKTVEVVHLFYDN